MEGMWEVKGARLLVAAGEQKDALFRVYPIHSENEVEELIVASRAGLRLMLFAGSALVSVTVAPLSAAAD
jgi:hypothetical protein